MNQTKIQKLKAADEVYGWYERYVQNPDKAKEPKMPFGVWLFHSLGKERKGETLIDNLSSWEWETLVASWRYFEHGDSISSAMFPGDIIERFWKSGRYSEAVKHKIAHQFAYIDHGLRGEGDWKVGCRGSSCLNNWCKFYAFCRAYFDGFTTVYLGGMSVYGNAVKAFHCETTNRWYLAHVYIQNPYVDCFCDEQLIRANARLRRA